MSNGTCTHCSTIVRTVLLIAVLFGYPAGNALSNPTGHPIGGGEDYDDWVTVPRDVVNTKEDLLNALSNATSNDVVYVDDDAVIDLTGEWNIGIPAGVTLASGRGRGGSLGARIFTRTQEKNWLFRVRGPGVRITGLRIQGPSTVVDVADCGGYDATGIYATSSDLVNWSLRVDNNELWAWPAAAINTSNVSGTHVHHNHIHHNRRKERTSGCRAYGLGYGVVTNLGNALIEANLFNHNRHDIASTGRPGSSYEARYNLSVKGLIGHSFDMHGCPDRPDDAACVDHSNTAGTRIDIHHNTFLQASEKAVVVRGIPEIGAFITENEFMHLNRAAAIHQRYAAGNLSVQNNRYAIRPRTGWFVSFSGRSYWTYRERSSYAPQNLGIGDFDNDGRHDALRSAGGSWYISPGFRSKWQKWNTSDIGVSQLRFGDFDGDGSTDVFRASGGKWYVSWSGRSRWEQINSSSHGVSQLRFADFDGDGKTDVFRSDSGKWFVSLAGKTRWQRLNRSNVRVQELRFADFNGDGEADVFRSTGSEWRVSWSGTSGWQRLNTSSVRVSRLGFCDFNADGKDDVFYANGSEWRVSWSGTSRWEHINSSAYSTVSLADVNGDNKCDVLSRQGF